MAAMCLYAGRVTDTGRFAYPSVGPDTLRSATILLCTGFNMGFLISRINERSMENVNFVMQCNLADDKRKGGGVHVHHPGCHRQIPSYSGHGSETLSCMRDIRNHTIFVLFADLNGKVRVESMSDRIMINQVAVAFGGDGHAFACGA